MRESQRNSNERLNFTRPQQNLMVGSLGEDSDGWLDFLSACMSSFTLTTDQHKVKMQFWFGQSL